MTRSAVALTVALCLLIVPVNAQSLTTTFASNNGQSGNMFDIVASNNLVIDDLDVNLDPGSFTVEVYVVTAGGSHVGNEANPGAWTLVGSAAVTSAGTNLATNLGLSLGVAINAGATQGFYVTTTATAMNYTNGTALGAVFASDANMQILEGTGNAYPFGGVFTPRVWNGTVHYSTGPGPEQLVATTTGVGDLMVSGPDDPPGTTEGYLLVSNDTTGPLGGGPIVGLYPDALTFGILGSPATVGGLFHYIPSPATFPNVDLIFPPGSLPTGISYDGVLVQLDATAGSLTISNVARVNL